MLETNMSCEAATRTAAAFPGFRVLWASLAEVGANHARTQNSVQATGNPDAPSTALRPVQAQAQSMALTMAQPVALPIQLAAVTAAELPPVSDTRKQKNIHKTRSGAGGYGAMGPHPEREQPA
jgi:hypothetical protein